MRARERGVVFVVAALAAASCAHERHGLSAAALRATNASTLVVYTAPNGRFDDFYPRGVFDVSLLSELGTMSQSSAVARERGIVDPALQVGVSLAYALAGAYSLQLVTATSGPDTLTPVRPRAGADLILDVNTTWWGIKFAPSKRLGRYAVHLEMEATLTDLRSGKELARGACTGDDPRTAGGVRYDDFEGDDGALVKQQLGWAAARCERFFRERILALPAAPSEGS
jgi:hypothetical protein